MRRTIKILLSIPKTIYFNFRYLPIRQALKLPIWLAPNVRVKNMYKGGIDGDLNIIRKTKCFRILERNAIISKTKRNFSRLYPTPQKIKKNRPASPERNTFEGS